MFELTQQYPEVLPGVRPVRQTLLEDEVEDFMVSEEIRVQGEVCRGRLLKHVPGKLGTNIKLSIGKGWYDSITE